MKNLSFLCLLCACLLFACTGKQGRAAQEAAAPDNSIPDTLPMQITDPRVYQRIEDQGSQGRDTFRLEGGRYTHINWNGIGQKWLMESTLLDTAANGIWIVRTTGYDYNHTPIDTRDSLLVRKFDEEATISPWLGNKPAPARRIERLQ